jgi:hypothetical protein
MSPENAFAMVDAYHGLLAQAGVTGPMLVMAYQRIVMRPANGKPKFFPDPGEIVDACREEIATRHERLASLEKAQALVDAPLADEPPKPAPSRLSVAEVLAKHGREMRCSAAREREPAPRRSGEPCLVSDHLKASKIAREGVTS